MNKDGSKYDLERQRIQCEIAPRSDGSEVSSVVPGDHTADLKLAGLFYDNRAKHYGNYDLISCALIG